MNKENSKSFANESSINTSVSNNSLKKDDNEIVIESNISKSKSSSSDRVSDDSKNRDITGLEYDESRNERIMARRMRIESNKKNSSKPKNLNNVLIKNKNDSNNITGKSKQQTQKSRKYIESTK
eukprot:jgi/Orpsp1_1/1179564/evm.model.c7180000069872.2